jgi:hypothetical protein
MAGPGTCFGAVPAAPAGIRRAEVGPGGQGEGAHAVGEPGGGRSCRFSSLEQGLDGRAQPIDARGQDGLDGRRDVDGGDRSCEAVAAGIAHERSGLDQRARATRAHAWRSTGTRSTRGGWFLSC